MNIQLFAQALLAAQASEMEALHQYDELLAVSELLNEVRPFIEYVDVHPEAIKEIEDILKDDYSNRTVRFLNVLAEEGYLKFITSITEAYELLLIDESYLVDVEIMSSQSLSEEAKERLLTMIAKRYPKRLKINYSIDPSLIAGLKIRINDELIDTSLAQRLNYLKEEV